MKQIYYVIQTLLRGRGSNIIKVISLGLGLTMSILLFSRVAYEQSFDTCFKDYDNLYQGWSVSFSQAPSVRRTGGLSYCLQKRAMKSSARGMMSSGRSRNEGISRCIVLMRYSKSSRNSPFATISGRLRFVAQISRMSTGMGVLLPTRTMLRRWMAVSSLACRW